MAWGKNVSIVVPAPFYALFNTKRGGNPAMVVVNSALLRFGHRDIFPWQLSIIIEARDLAGNGMPTVQENTILNDLGDALEAALMRPVTEHGSTNTLFLARVTCDGERTLLYRVHDAKRVDVELKRLTSVPNVREWSYDMRGDVEWKLAEVFFKLLNGANG